jgi:hypothetical protein
MQMPGWPGICINDAIELLVEGQLGPLAEEAERDFREGAVKSLEQPGPHPVVLAQQAAEVLQSDEPARSLRASGGGGWREMAGLPA